MDEFRAFEELIHAPLDAEDVLPTPEQRFAEKPYQKVYLKDDYYYGKGNYAKYIKGKYSKAV